MSHIGYFLTRNVSLLVALFFLILPMYILLQRYLCLKLSLLPTCNLTRNSTKHAVRTTCERPLETLLCSFSLHV